MEPLDAIQTFADIALSTVWELLVQHNLVLSTESVSHHLSFIVSRRNKKKPTKVNGDFIILLRGDAVIHSPDILSIIAEELRKRSQEWDLPIQACSYQHGQFLLKLNRSSIFKTFIGQVMRQGDLYGRSSGLVGEKVTIFLAELIYEARMCVSRLRAVLLAEHVKRLLEASGAECDIYYPRIDDEQLNEFLSCCTELPSPDVESIINLLRESKYAEAGESSKSGDSNGNDSCTISGKQFIEDHEMSDFYNKDLDRIHVINDDSRIQIIAGLNALKSQTLFHVIRSDHEHQHQKFDLLRRIQTQLMSQTRQLNSYQLVHGKVSPRKDAHAQSLDLEDFWRLRKEQNREASVAKFGTDIVGKEWDNRIRTLTLAGIRFELLSPNCRTCVKLDITEEFSRSDARSGSFVLYNYARLCNLIGQFENDVTQGAYPELPDYSQVDFSCLREEEEWELLIKFIIPYRCLVENVLNEWKSRNGHIQTHTVCQFLYQFSRALSSYYNRYHVLGESRSHLLERMFARVHLLKAAHQIMRNGLDLLSIRPLELM